MKSNGSGVVRWLTGGVIALLVVTVGVSAVSASVELVDADAAPAAEPEVLSTTLRAVTARVEAPTCPSGQLFSAQTDTFSGLLESSGVNDTLTINGFDSSLGTLESVVIVTAIGMNGSGTFTPDPALTEPQTLTIAGFLSASLTNGDGHGNLSTTGVPSLGQSVGPVDPGVTAPFQFVGDFDNGNASFNTQAASAPFVGGSFSWQLTALGAITYEGGPNKTVQDTTSLTASVRATYCYTPPPGTFTISKTVSAGKSATIPTFRFAVACSNGTEQLVSLGAGESETIELQPASTTCSVAELFDNDEAGRWAPAVNGDCGQSIDDVGDGDTVAFTNTLWDVYATCPAAASGG